MQRSPVIEVDRRRQHNTDLHPHALPERWASELNLLELYSLSSFLTILANRVSSQRGVLWCTDVILGKRATAVWIRPHDRAMVSHWEEHDAYKTLFAAVFLGPLSPTAQGCVREVCMNSPKECVAIRMGWGGAMYSRRRDCWTRFKTTWRQWSCWVSPTSSRWAHQVLWRHGWGWLGGGQCRGNEFRAGFRGYPDVEAQFSATYVSQRSFMRARRTYNDTATWPPPSLQTLGPCSASPQQRSCLAETIWRLECFYCRVMHWCPRWSG